MARVVTYRRARAGELATFTVRTRTEMDVRAPLPDSRLAIKVGGVGG